MAWFGDGLSSLSNLKGQITNFTKEVLSESVIEDADQRISELEEANERCVRMREALDAKDAEISLLRRQNCELQKAAIELNARPRETNDTSGPNDEGGGRGDAGGNGEDGSLRDTSSIVDDAEDEPEIERLDWTSMPSQNDSRDAERETTDPRVVCIDETGREAERNPPTRKSPDEIAPSDASAPRGEAIDVDEERESRTGGVTENGNSLVDNEVENLRETIRRLQRENVTLTRSLEDLDEEHARSVETLLAVKDELGRKHESLQIAYEQLYVERNEALARLRILEDAAREKVTITDEKIFVDVGTDAIVTENGNGDGDSLTMALKEPVEEKTNSSLNNATEEAVAEVEVALEGEKNASSSDEASRKSIEATESRDSSERSIVVSEAESVHLTRIDELARATMILGEKCATLEAALHEERSTSRALQNRLIEVESREANAAKELERLRAHLCEMEASSTEEHLRAEERRERLASELQRAEEKVRNASTAYTSASIRANQRVETLQQQMALIVQQRDEIRGKLSVAEDQIMSHSASLTNLQIVLEQFQRDKENDTRIAAEKHERLLNASYKEQEDLRNEIVDLGTQLSEAKECLRAASRLSEQLEKKSEKIAELNEEVARLTELADTADRRVREVANNERGKVDKNLVKNLLLGFLTSSTVDKSSVLRVFATVLEFDETERDKIGLNHPAAVGGWFSGLLRSGGSASAKDREASLSAAFVRFLESESKPKPQLPPLTISNSHPGHNRRHSSSSMRKGLLLSDVALPSFPDFVPSRNTGSILKEILKDS